MVDALRFTGRTEIPFAALGQCARGAADGIAVYHGSGAEQPPSPTRRGHCEERSEEAIPIPLALGQEIASLALAMTLRVSFAACGGGVRRLRQAPNRSRSAPRSS